jgi:hypothetical protein
MLDDSVKKKDKRWFLLGAVWQNIGLKVGVTKLDAELARLELGFRDSCCFCSSHQNVDFIRDIIHLTDANNLIKETEIGEMGVSLMLKT